MITTARLALALGLGLGASALFSAEASPAELAPQDATWFPFSTGGVRGVPFDLTFLNKDAQGAYISAGAHGFVTVKDGDFVFEDGTPVRFWGMNVTAGAALGGQARAAEITELLARCGVNLVRLHHLDSWFKPIVNYKGPSPTGELDPASMRALDAFIFEAKKRGIYVNLDPWVQRHFTEADGVPDYGRQKRLANFNLHPFVYFDPRMQELVRKQWRDVWTHVNEFTGVAYKDEPAIVITQVINEGLLYNLKDVTQPVYIERLRAVYERWAAEHNGTPWEKAQILARNDGRNNIAFLMWLHARFYEESRDYLRSLGVRVPMNMNNWGLWPWVLAAQDQGEIMDRHFYYGGDAVGPGKGLGNVWLGHSPRTPEGPFSKFAAWSLPGKAFTSSECGQHFPKTFRSAYLPGLAAMAAFQGWDGFTGFSFSQAETAGTATDPFNWETDPSILASFAAGALIYRRGDVRPAQQTVVYHLSDDEIYNPRWGKADVFWNLPGYAALVEQHRLVTCLPDDKPARLSPARVVTEADVKTLATDSTELRSDTGELWRDWALAVGTIDTPRTQVAYGRLGTAGRPLATRDATFAITTPYASVTLSSLTNDPLGQSKRLLLTATARAENTGTTYKGNALAERGVGPVLLQPVVGEIRLRTAQTSLTLYPLSPDGSRRAGVPVPVADGTATITLTPELRTVGALLEAP